MIGLKFCGLSAWEDRWLGPAPWFVIGGPTIRQGPEDRVVAQLDRHQWAVQGVWFSRWECPTSAEIVLCDGQGDGMAVPITSGNVYGVDGAVYGDGRLIASYDEERRMWRCSSTDRRWPSVVIK